MTGGEPADAAEDEGARLFREDQAALFSVLAKLLDEREMEEGELAALLIDAVYHFRSLAYVVDTPKPSETGLKMDLDRLRKLIDEVHRDYRKNAAAVISDMISVLDAVAAELETGSEAEAEAAGPPSVLSDGSGR